MIPMSSRYAKVLSTCKTSSKITGGAVFNQQILLTTSDGALCRYAMHSNKVYDLLVLEEGVPLSAIEAVSFDSVTDGQIVVGNWRGEVALVRLSHTGATASVVLRAFVSRDVPIKKIKQLGSHLLVSTTKAIHLCDLNANPKSTLHVGTYLIAIVPDPPGPGRSMEQRVVAISGFKIHFLQIEHGRLTLVTEENIQEFSGNNHTLIKASAIEHRPNESLKILASTISGTLVQMEVDLTEHKIDSYEVVHDHTSLSAMFRGPITPWINDFLVQGDSVIYAIDRYLVYLDLIRKMSHVKQVFSDRSCSLVKILCPALTDPPVLVVLDVNQRLFVVRININAPGICANPRDVPKEEEIESVIRELENEIDNGLV